MIFQVNEKDGDSCDRRGVIDYGERVWGSCGEKTICIRNNGFATVPLRLAIMSVSMMSVSIMSTHLYFDDTYVVVDCMIQINWLVNRDVSGSRF